MAGNKDTMLAASYSGPLPPASQFEKYEQAVPGAGDRILAMAERQGKHRQDLEFMAMTGSIISERLGAIFAFCIALAGIAAGTYLVVSGKSVEGLVAIITPLAGLAAVFFYGSRKAEKTAHDRR